jgi:hypothetical protein
MPRFDIARDAFAGCFRNGRLWLIQFFANPLLFALFVAWLFLPPSNGFYLVLNFILGLALLAAAFLLHAGTLNYFSDLQSGAPSPLWPPFRRALQHLLPVAICVGVFWVLWIFVTYLDSFQDTFPAYLRSTFPVFLRRHITLSAVANLFSAAIFFARWILAPGFVLPLLLQAADRGFHGFGRQGITTWRKTVFSLAYWLVLLLAALLGVLAVDKLMALKPNFKDSTFHGEAFSLALRLAASYLLGLFSWLLVCSTVGRYASAAGSASDDVPGNPTA